MIRRPPRSTLFPTRRSSDLQYRAAKTSRERGLFTLHAYADPVGAVGEIGVADEGTRKKTGLAEDLKSVAAPEDRATDRKSTRLNSSHSQISYAVFCLKKRTN